MCAFLDICVHKNYECAMCRFFSELVRSKMKNFAKFEKKYKNIFNEKKDYSNKINEEENELKNKKKLGFYALKSAFFSLLIIRAKSIRFKILKFIYNN